MSLDSYIRLAAQRGIPADVLTERLIKLHWDIPLAVLLPPDVRANLAFISLDNIAYYEVPWSVDPYISARQLIEKYIPQELPFYDILYSSGHYAPYTEGGEV